MSAATKDIQQVIDEAVLCRVRRDRERIIDAIVKQYRLDYDDVTKTVTGRFPGSLNEAKA